MTSTRQTRCLALMLAVLAGSLGGCHLLSWVVVAFVPKPKVAARYEFPAGRKILVFPDNPHSSLEHPSIKQLLTKRLNEKLADQNIADETVPYELLRLQQEQMDRRYRMTEGRAAPLDAIARELGADTVIYCDIRKFSLRTAPQEPVWKGSLTVKIRIVDDSGTRLWPVDRADGYELKVDLPPSSNESKTFGLTLTEQLADRMADRIAKLFYAHRPAS